MPFTVRSAILADADAVTQVLCESRRVFVSFAPMIHTPEEVRAWIIKTVIPGGNAYVATHASQIMAMLVVSYGKELSWIDQLYVKPGFTDQGIGAMLLRFAHSKLKPPIRLYTFQANTGARRFYQRHGYKAIEFTDGVGNEERCPDVLYEWHGVDTAT